MAGSWGALPGWLLDMAAPGRGCQQGDISGVGAVTDGRAAVLALYQRPVTPPPAIDEAGVAIGRQIGGDTCRGLDVLGSGPVPQGRGRGRASPGIAPPVIVAGLGPAN